MIATHAISQFQLPGLADQVLAETAVRLGGDQHEAGVLIDLAGGDQDALGPQRDLAIAAGLREARCIRRPAAGPMPCPRPAGSTSSRRSLATSSVCLTRNTEPTGAPSMSAIQQRSREASNEVEEFAPRSRRPGLERGVEAVFAGVERAVALHHPAHVAGAVARAGSAGACGAAVAEQPFDRRPSPRSAVGRRRRRQRCEHRADVVLRTALELGEGLPSLGGQASRYCRRSDGSGLRVIRPSSSKFWTMRLR